MVKNGIDIISREKYSHFKKLRLGLIVNPSSVKSNLQHDVYVFLTAKFPVACLFSPEHGLWGSNQDQVKEGHTIDQETGLKVFSLYGRHKQPTATMLKGVDAIVYDVQDIGARYYTFIWTMTLAMEACAIHRKKMIVLDRPNPLTGAMLEGPVLDPAFKSFVGWYPVPVRHGMTVGEMAWYVQQEYLPSLDLEVVPMTGWQRGMWFDQTGLPWVMPSPNMPTLETAVVYPGMCLIEGTNISEGRGTTRPFEICGAPWIDPFTLVRAMEKADLPGCIFRPLFFKPTFHKFQHQDCGGLQIHVRDRDRYKPFLTAVAILQAAWRLYPRQAQWRTGSYEDESRLMAIDILAGNAGLRRDIERQTSLEKMEKEWLGEIARFQIVRKKYLLY